MPASGSKATACLHGLGGASLATLLILMGLQQPVLAASPPEPGIGQTKIVVNRVDGLLGPITRQLAIRDDVFSQEIIETGGDGATRIGFLDGTALSMGPSSKMTLDRFVYDPASGTGQMVMNFISGIFEFVSGSMDHAGYDLRTPFAHFSIRGTDIILDTITGLIAVPSGIILVRMNDGQVYEVKSGECLVKAADGTWGLVSGSCDQYLGRYGQMTSLLASVIEPSGGPLRTTSPPFNNGGVRYPPEATGFLTNTTQDRAASPN